MIESKFGSLLQSHGITIDALQLDKFAQYYRYLVEWNAVMNLTGIVDQEQVYMKHFYDSLTILVNIPLKQTESIADIGAGAGFPSIPLKIVYPNLSITIIESLSKRVKFLEFLVDKLQLENVKCVHGRAEDLARNASYREQFSVVTARAVARLNILNELCLPFVRVGGIFIAMKGTDNESERLEASNSLLELKSEIINIHQFRLPTEESQRQLIVIRKHAKTPIKYPRKAGIPAKMPL